MPNGPPPRALDLNPLRPHAVGSPSILCRVAWRGVVVVSPTRALKRVELKTNNWSFKTMILNNPSVAPGGHSGGDGGDTSCVFFLWVSMCLHFIAACERVYSCKSESGRRKRLRTKVQTNRSRPTCTHTYIKRKNGETRVLCVRGCENKPDQISIS